MRLCIVLFLFGISTTSLADGVDRVRIFLNGKIVANTLDGNINKTIIHFHAGDTLIFEAWTDWGGLDAATLDMVDSSGTTILTLQNARPEYNEAIFYYILNKELNIQHVNFILNYKTYMIKWELGAWDLGQLIFILSN